MKDRVKRQEAATAATAASITAETVPTIAKDLEAESEANDYLSTPIPDTFIDSDQDGFATGKEDEIDIEEHEDQDETNQAEESGTDSTNQSDAEVESILDEETNQGSITKTYGKAVTSNVKLMTARD